MTDEKLKQIASIRVVYVAGPFRAANSWEMEQNIRRAEALALDVWRTPGLAAICPHSNTRFYQGAAPDDVWLDGDLAILERCDAVLLVPGWEKSSGTRTEIEWARYVESIPVFETIESLREWAATLDSVEVGSVAYGR